MQVFATNKSYTLFESLLTMTNMNEEQIEKASYIASLITKRMQEIITADEQQSLDEWLNQNGENYLLYEELLNDMNESLEEFQQYDTQGAFKKLVTKLAAIKKINPVNISRA